MKSDIVFSHNSDDWKTPTDLYNKLIGGGRYIDPCPYKCQENNLNKDYGAVNLFINPPYSDIKSWVRFAIYHCMKYQDNHCLLLIPSRTDTKFFHEMMENENIDMGLYFFKGRLHFNDSNSAPFPSCLIKLSATKGKMYMIKEIEEIIKRERS